MLDQLKHFLKSHPKIDTNKKLALAVSGGADSMCMTLLMHQLKLNIVCIIIDHGLRHESKSDAKKTQNFLKMQNIESHIITWMKYDQNNTHFSNLHHKAREARYKLLIDYCMDNNIEYLAVAHNKNDQAENVLIRISRGTGIDGLADIKKLQQIDGINIIRPLLEYTRKEIEQILYKEGWQWIDDPSNQNMKFLRSKVRNLIKTNDCNITVDRLCLLSNNATRVRDFLETESEKAFRHSFNSDSFGNLILSIDRFLDLHTEIKLRIIARALRYINSQYSIRLESLERLIYEIDNINITWKDRTFHCCELLLVNSNQLLFIREKQFIQTIQCNSIPFQTLWDNRFSIKMKSNDNDISKSNIIITSMDKSHYQYIKKYIENNTIQKLLHHKIKWTLPVIIADNEVIAAPSLGFNHKMVIVKILSPL